MSILISGINKIISVEVGISYVFTFPLICQLVGGLETCKLDCENRKTKAHALIAVKTMAYGVAWVASVISRISAIHFHV